MPASSEPGGTSWHHSPYRRAASPDVARASPARVLDLLDGVDQFLKDFGVMYVGRSEHYRERDRHFGYRKLRYGRLLRFIYVNFQRADELIVELSVRRSRVEDAE